MEARQSNRQAAIGAIRGAGAGGEGDERGRNRGERSEKEGDRRKGEGGSV